ncbi:hypothetical protein EDB89DRAFT_1910949 [Lactarius sanguifluus]|nr:hypothetical protein EDB89DRAFT_1910949 [Lactarius sanguifluus]
MLQCSGVRAGSCAADRHGSGVGRGWRMWGRGGECGARPCCWPRQSRGLAMLVVTGLVDVAPGLVGVAPGLVGVTSRLVGVAPGLVSVAPGIVIVEPGWSWHGIVGVAWAGVAIVGPGSR